MLVTIHERRNSFVLINRIPLEILSLIPTHLSSQVDRLWTTFVCHHWCRTFLEHPALWSEVYLRKGEVYLKILLERMKGSTLDIVSCFSAPARIMTLLPPHTKQIRSLDFDCTLWADIQRFLELNSGPLLLFCMLRISATGVECRPVKGRDAEGGSIQEAEIERVLQELTFKLDVPNSIFCPSDRNVINRLQFWFG